MGGNRSREGQRGGAEGSKGHLREGGSEEEGVKVGAQQSRSCPVMQDGEGAAHRGRETGRRLQRPREVRMSETWSRSGL